MFDDTALESVVFVGIPDSLLHLLTHVYEGEIPDDLKLPLERRDTDSEFSSDEISIEAFVAGMLKLLAYDPEHRHTQIYRAIILASRPEIYAELAETGIINAGNGNHEIAEEIFSALAGLDPSRVEGPVNLAIVYEQHADRLEKIGRTTEVDTLRSRAASLYRTLLQEEDQDIPLDVRLNAGLFFMKIHDYESGRAQLDYYANNSDDTEKAARAQRIIEQVDSQNLLDRLFKEAYDFIAMGEEERGIESISEFLERYPDVWNAWFLLGWGHRRLGNFDDAADAFERAIDLGADTADAYNELAICRLELGDFVETRRHLTTALKMEPENTKIISNMGVLALRENDLDEARRFFLTVIEIEPEDPVALQYLASLGEDR